ncbi:MAG: o-succinylbenzoate synthase [Candidatus Marinimicrobia bacterium]|nr:o-succinylbenzoate synthase [Candidatus Neomarinimicrobiota bacterium]
MNAPNFAGIRLAPQFQNVSLELRSARLYKFSLPLKHELELKHTTLKYREGLILILTDTSGHVGFGEISPLPGYSRETIETAVYKTTMLVDRIINFGEFTSHQYSRANLNWEKRTAPSVVYFGIETALLALLANARSISLGAMLYGHSSNKIPINGLIRSSISHWVPEADYLINEGYSTLKIKVGRINPILEARGIQEIRQFAGPGIKLRLDANRSWDLETALEFGKIVASENIEYIEEPIENPADLPRFYDGCGVHFAFDETLHNISDPTISFDSYTGLKALVLKPTLIGCTARFISLVNQAKDQNILPVLSSSYESDVGLAALAQLAGSITGEDLAVGLDTRSALTSGTVKKPSSIQNGWMPVRTLTTQDLDLSSCELLYQS